MSFKHALANKSFCGHLIAQFSVAFNDNYFKQVVLFFAARKLFPDQDRQGVGIMVFSVPFILFSGYAGQISEKFSKQRIVLWMKVLEVLVAVMAAYALYCESWLMLLVVLFTLSLQSTIMSPTKYAILPEIVESKNLIVSNSVMAILTFTGILMGMAAAGPAFDFLIDTPWIMGSICVVLALMGMLGAMAIGSVPAQEPELVIARNPFRGLWAGYVGTKEDVRVMVVVLLNSILWMNGAALVQVITAYGAEGYLAIPEGQTWKISVLFVVLTLSIVTGCLVVPKLSHRFTPGGLMTGGMAAAALAELGLVAVCTFAGPNLGYPLAILCIFGVGFSAAFALIPIQTSLQVLPPPGLRGQTIALNNVLSFTGMFLAGLVYDVGARYQVNPGFSLLLIAVLLVFFLKRWQGSLAAVKLPLASR